MPSKDRKRWPPTMGEFKKMVAAVAAEVPSGDVTDIFHTMRRRCPDWVVTPYRVRKAIGLLAKSKNKSKSGGNGGNGSADSVVRPFPHDVVELRPHALRARQAQWQWRGQVLRVHGYDDGEAMDPDEHDLPPGHCYVFWLGCALEQWPGALTKENAIRVLDRPWVLGDRVARADDPRSLGTVVGVNCHLTAAGMSGSTRTSPEVQVQGVRAVGGFCAEDWVAHEATRWVGKVEEAVFRVQVELCSKGEQRTWSRGKSRHTAPLCEFQVSSEGLQGLEPASGGDDVSPQELSPHFPGQRVKAPARLWRQAQWLRGNLGRRSPRRGMMCGTVVSVECSLLAVRWLGGAVKASAPDEWVPPESVRVLTMPNSSEGWGVGGHVMAPANWCSPTAVIIESRTQVDVRWSDGTLEESVSSLKLCPRPHISAHDFLPNDFVARSPEAFVEPVVSGFGAVTVNRGNNSNYEEATYGYSADSEAGGPAEIVPSEREELPLPPDVPLGVVKSVNMQARTAVIQWIPPPSDDPGQLANSLPDDEGEEVSVFELTDHPNVDVRFGDAVMVSDAPETEHMRWAGRVVGLRFDGHATVSLLDGNLQEYDVRKLIVVDDGEGSESAGGDGAASEADSTHSGMYDDEPSGDRALAPVIQEQERTESDSEWFWDERDPQDRNDHPEPTEAPGEPWYVGPQGFVGPIASQGIDTSAAAPSRPARGFMNWVFGGDTRSGGPGDWSLFARLTAAATTPETVGPGATTVGSSASSATSSRRGPGVLAERQVASPASSVCPCSSIATAVSGRATIDAEGGSEEIGGSSASSSAAPAMSVVQRRRSDSQDSTRADPDAAEGNLPAFDICDEDLEPSDHFFVTQSTLGTKNLMMAVRREMMFLRKGLLDSSEGCSAPIVVRTFSARSDLFRAMVVGPEKTPYAYVPFFFDFALPPGYPREPPLAHFHSYLVGHERLNPNLYVDGKVCLSLLGTWSGPAWDPQRSTLLQVLVSLQGLVLVEEPYYNEPGHECDVGTEQGRQSSSLYNEHARLSALRAALNTSQSPPRGFEEIVAAHFSRYGPLIVKECEEALVEPKSFQTSEGFRKVLSKTLLPRLVARWGSSADFSTASAVCMPASSATQ